jgi:hypothetical protein
MNIMISFYGIFAIINYTCLPTNYCLCCSYTTHYALTITYFSIHFYITIVLMIIYCSATSPPSSSSTINLDNSMISAASSDVWPVSYRYFVVILLAILLLLLAPASVQLSIIFL